MNDSLSLFRLRAEGGGGVGGRRKKKRGGEGRIATTIQSHMHNSITCVTLLCGCVVSLYIPPRVLFSSLPSPPPVLRVRFLLFGLDFLVHHPSSRFFVKTRRVGFLAWRKVANKCATISHVMIRKCVRTVPSSTSDFTINRKIIPNGFFKSKFFPEQAKKWNGMSNDYKNNKQWGKVKKRERKKLIRWVIHNLSSSWR